MNVTARDSGVRRHKTVMQRRDNGGESDGRPFAMTSILLTSPDSELIAAAGRIMPEAEVIPLRAGPPARLPDGPAWCFVDWLLPDMSGLEVCRQLRAVPRTAGAHVTMVLESDDLAARRRALGAGADDYMLGPLSPERLEARLREYGGGGCQGPQVLSGAGMSLDRDSHQVRWRGKLVTLRPREFALLAVFLANPDRLLTRHRLIGLIGDEVAIGDERTVDVWVGRLRRSLEAQGVPRIVRTVRAHGYVFDTPDLRL